MIAILADDRVDDDPVTRQALLDDPWWQRCRNHSEFLTRPASPFLSFRDQHEVLRWFHVQLGTLLVANNFVAKTDAPSPPATDSATSGGTVPSRPVAPSFAKRYYTILVGWFWRIGIAVCLLFALYICYSFVRSRLGFISLQTGQKQRERHNPQQGVPSVQLGQSGPTTNTGEHGAATFEDDFASDHFLNESIWSTHGEALNAHILKADTRFVPVRLAFSSLGMSMAGVDGEEQSTGIQSARTFSTPLTSASKGDGDYC